MATPGISQMYEPLKCRTVSANVATLVDFETHVNDALG